MNPHQHKEGQGETVYFGVTVEPNLEENIRQIVREEIAAHLDGGTIAKLLGEHMKKRRKANGESWIDDTL